MKLDKEMVKEAFSLLVKSFKEYLLDFLKLNSNIYAMVFIYISGFQNYVNSENTCNNVVEEESDEELFKIGPKLLFCASSISLTAEGDNKLV